MGDRIDHSKIDHAKDSDSGPRSNKNNDEQQVGTSRKGISRRTLLLTAGAVVFSSLIYRLYWKETLNSRSEVNEWLGDLFDNSDRAKEIGFQLLQSKKVDPDQSLELVTLYLDKFSTTPFIDYLFDAHQNDLINDQYGFYDGWLLSTTELNLFGLMYLLAEQDPAEKK